MADEIKPLFYVKGREIFHRAVRNAVTGGVTLGFRVCHVWDSVEPEDLCTILNKGAPATSHDLSA